MSKLSLKTRILNELRKILMRPMFENHLIRLMEKSSRNPLIVGILPSNYLYPPHSIRKTCDRNIEFELDLHNWNDWEVYFRAHPKVINKLFQLCKPRNVIIDVGCNIGYVLMNMAKIAGPEGKVFGFEPSPETFAKLQRNLEINHFNNITVTHAALGNVPGKAVSYPVRDSNLGMNKIRLVSNEDLPDVVPVFTLDSFCEAEKLTRVDVIKIDVEGYELNVLKGSLTTLRKFRPYLFIEISCQNLSYQNSSPEKLLELLRAEGYIIQRAIDGRIIMPSHVLEKDCHFDILAVPSQSGNDQ